MRARIDLHMRLSHRRGPEWTTIEEPYNLLDALQTHAIKKAQLPLWTASRFGFEFDGRSGHV